MRTLSNSAKTFLELEQKARDWFTDNYGPEYGKEVDVRYREIVDLGVRKICFYSKKEPALDVVFIGYLVADYSI